MSANNPPFMQDSPVLGGKQSRPDLRLARRGSDHQVDHVQRLLIVGSANCASANHQITIMAHGFKNCKLALQIKREFVRLHRANGLAAQLNIAMINLRQQPTITGPIAVFRKWQRPQIF